MHLSGKLFLSMRMFLLVKMFFGIKRLFVYQWGEGMANIVFASSKGGCGKTTAATVLASELARQGRAQSMSIALIDADPNQHSAAWATLPGVPVNLQLYAKATERNLSDVIEEAENANSFVIVDLEGTASMAVAMAINYADLVIIPCQGSDKDAFEAIKTIGMIKQQSKAIRRSIRYAVLMTCTKSAIVTRGLKAIIGQFKAADLPVYNTQLIEREAFRAIASFGGIVNDLPASKVSGIDKAAKNAFAFTKETIAILNSEHTTPLNAVGG